jgi:hypothetical protein
MSGSLGSVIPAYSIGFNSTTTASGSKGNLSFTSGQTGLTEAVASYITAPALGVNVVTSLENGTTGGTLVIQGTEANMVLTTRWRA